ncbi:cell wall-binding repeat-containing protein [Leifsonia shinshuensis]|uniref:Putative cell wall-binding protein n=1 Tax=Leifsonia shinshuensis TaxID=150026 RepID=A0A853CXZ0_9MICO|nr:cell wall-binding repeat-containing protein [Leifsonia shinshuensis]NYJ25398.1 putative cell wall-binding protein [Leifsonia shinshuensis]
MRDHAAAAVPVHDHFTTAPPRRLRRTLAGAAVAALAVTGVVAAGMPASANPGTGGYTNAFTASVGGTVTDVAVDSYTAQAFAARSGGVDIVDENSGARTATVPLPGATSPVLDADATRAYVWALDAANNKLYRIDERTNSATPVSIAGDLRDVAVDHTTGKVFVTTGSTGTVVPVDEVTLAVGTPIPVSGTLTRIGVDSAAGVLYVVDSAGLKVSVVAEAAGTVSGSVTVTANMTAITVDSAHHKAYLGSAALNNTVAVIDGSALTGSSVDVSTPGYSGGVTSLGIDPSTQTVIGRNGGQIFRIDTTTGSSRFWNPMGSSVTAGDIAVDVYTNTALYAAANTVLAQWEPISILGSISGVVPAGAPYSQVLNGYADPGSPVFSISGGALPTGLALNGDTISGTATTPGTYTFNVTATNAGYGDSVTQTYSLHVVTVDRTAGADRFATSVEVSKASYPAALSSTATLYIANGVSFPDALSGGPAATQGSGPLLLTAPGYLPTSVSDEIKRLKPQHVVVVGGPAVVSEDVVTALKQLSPDVQRVYGGDRFGTSQAVIQHAFTSAPLVYVTTGLNFPDSLSAGGAAGSLHAPLLLVNGGATSVDTATANLLSSMHTTKIVVIGGSAVMSPSLVADFARFGTVTHLAGVDRFDSSQQIVETAFGHSSRVLLANGLNFPDALGASAWSGSTASPLFITLGGCVPQRTLDDIYFLGATEVTLVGGTSVLNADAAALTSCGGWSVIAPTYPALAPAAAKTGGSAGSGLVYDHPVAPSLPVNPRTHH